MKSSKKHELPYTKLVWVINNLPPKDLEKVDKMDVTLELINNFLTQEMENGAKISFKYDNYSDCASMSMVYLDADSPNDGYAVSGRGKDFVHCATILIYKFFEVAHEKLYELTDARQKRPKYG